MADDLVVREFAEIAKEWTRDKAPYNWGDYAETGALARAYLAMTAERDAVYDKADAAHCEYERHLEECLSEVKNERDAALDKLAASEAALRKYGWHKVGCPHHHEMPVERCTCGFDEALAGSRC